MSKYFHARKMVAMKESVEAEVDGELFFDYVMNLIHETSELFM